MADTGMGNLTSTSRRVWLDVNFDNFKRFAGPKATAAVIHDLPFGR